MKIQQADCQRPTPSAEGKKCMHAHDGTLQLPITGHLPCFICFHGKNSGQIIFEQPSYRQIKSQTIILGITKKGWFPVAQC